MTVERAVSQAQNTMVVRIINSDHYHTFDTINVEPSIIDNFRCYYFYDVVCYSAAYLSLAAW